MVTLTKTIGSCSYVLGVTKANLIKDSFTCMYLILSKYVNPNSPNKFWYPAFPEKAITDGGLNYPVGIIDSPTISWDAYTIERVTIKCSMSISVYATNAKDADYYISEAINAIDTERNELWIIGIRKVNLITTGGDHIMHDQLKIHNRSATFEFEYIANSGLYG